MKFALPALTLFLSACSLFPKLTADSRPAPSQPTARSPYELALVKYRDGRFEAALNDFGAAVSSGKLAAEEEVNARKHIAFIHCSNGREVPCREQFQAILKAQPQFDLAANEASHPVWGPVWRSVKGAVEEQRTVAKANSFLASAAQQKLAKGLKEYEEGDFNQAVGLLQDALKSGLPSRPAEIIAHKYSAFSYCMTHRKALCRDEFQKIFALDPHFRLLPAEHGHPAWTPSYRSEKSAASRRMR